MRWEKKLTKEQHDQIENVAEELMEESFLVGADCGVALDAGWNAIQNCKNGKLDVRFKVTFFGLTEEEVRAVIENGAELAQMVN